MKRKLMNVIVYSAMLLTACMLSRFVLLHYYIKKTQKAPVKEIEKARKNLKDFLERNEEL